MYRTLLCYDFLQILHYEGPLSLEEVSVSADVLPHGVSFFTAPEYLLRNVVSCICQSTLRDTGTAIAVSECNAPLPDALPLLFLFSPLVLPRKAQQQLQSHLAVAAAAMNPYSAAGYGRGLQQQLDPYHSQHLQQYRTQLELPRGYMLSASQASGPYLAAGPHLGYYGHQYPAMLQRVTSVGGESGAQVNASAAPEPAPPPLHASPTPPQQHQQQHHLHQESILSSLLAARSERLAAGIEDAESSHVAEKAEAAAIESLPAASGSSSEAGASGLMSEKRRQGRSNGLLGQLLDAAGSTSRAEKGRSDSITLAAKDPTVSRTTEPSPHLQPSMTSSPHLGPEPAGVGGLGPAAAAALTAATAMHFTGLRGQFTASSHMHHSMGATMPGMTPPLQAGVTMPGGLGASAGPQASSVSSRLPVHVNQPLPPDAAAMSAVQYMGAAPGTVPGTVTGPVGPPMQSTAFSSHDAFEEHMRQQEKKLQKRAANRKSAQLSRKRKKALIEDLKYENQDLQRHEDILEVIPDPVFAFDALSGGVWFASNSASAQFGLSVEDLTSTCFFDLMTEDCSKRLRVLIENASKDISETGSSLLHEVTTFLLGNKDKVFVGLGHVCSDARSNSQHFCWFRGVVSGSSYLEKTCLPTIVQTKREKSLIPA